MTPKLCLCKRWSLTRTARCSNAAAPTMKSPRRRMKYRLSCQDGRRGPSKSCSGPTRRRQGSPRQRVDFLVPPLEYALPLGRAAIFGEVICDEFQVAHFERPRRYWRALVRRRLEVLEVTADFLRGRRKRPIVEFFRVVEVARAFDDAHRSNLVAGPFARDDDLYRESVGDFGEPVMQKRDGNRRFAACDGTDGARPCTRIVVRVLVHALQQFE